MCSARKFLKTLPSFLFVKLPGKILSVLQNNLALLIPGSCRTVICRTPPLVASVNLHHYNYQKFRVFEISLLFFLFYMHLYAVTRATFEFFANEKL